jgi:HSP20 family molecular chaperone IbpA
MDMFDEIFNGMSLFGYRPMRLVFNSNVKDMNPYSFKKTDEGFIGTVKTLGISEKDIKVTVEDYGIKVSGESEIDGEKYNTEIQIAINDSVMADLKEIKYHCQDGLTFINLILDNKRKKILINGK